MEPTLWDYLIEPTRETQNAELLAALRRGPVNALEALHELGIYRCGARVYDLRKRGYDIRMRRESGHVATYWLVES
jgi:hypothetical protein